MKLTADKLVSSEDVFVGQLRMIRILIIATVGMGLIELIWPSFFNYPYAYWSDLSTVVKFWPLFLYAFMWALWSCKHIEHPHHANEYLFAGAVTSILAGVWEELAYRAVFICYTMIALVFINFLWTSGASILSLVPGGLIVLMGLYLWHDKGQRLLGGLGIFLGCGLAWWGLSWGVGTDPVYWFYEHIVVTVINFVTLSQFEAIFYNGHEPMFVFGAIVANAWFRDGHKYQGYRGWINSWIMGFVLLYATVTYGLWTAVLLHVIYDLEFDITHYFYRKLML